MASAALDAYLSKFHEVEGWCNPRIFQAITTLRAEQARLRVEGGVAEIGVHHGKFLIGLHNVAEGATTLAIDVFEQQALNVDFSGSGSLEAFRRNVARFAARPENVSCHQGDSLALHDRQVMKMRNAHGPFSLFSIDGGHTPEHTINDFRLAERLVANGAIVFLDDFNNIHWPGVREGFSYLFINDRPKLVPFMFHCTKLFLTTLGFHRAYHAIARDVIAPGAPDANFKAVRIFGHDVVVSHS